MKTLVNFESIFTAAHDIENREITHITATPPTRTDSNHMTITFNVGLGEVEDGTGDVEIEFDGLIIEELSQYPNYELSEPLVDVVAADYEDKDSFEFDVVFTITLDPSLTDDETSHVELKPILDSELEELAIVEQAFAHALVKPSIENMLTAWLALNSCTSDYEPHINAYLAGVTDSLINNTEIKTVLDTDNPIARSIFIKGVAVEIKDLSTVMADTQANNIISGLVLRISELEDLVNHHATANEVDIKNRNDELDLSDYELTEIYFNEADISGDVGNDRLDISGHYETVFLKKSK